VALYRRELADRLIEVDPEYRPASPVHAAILDILQDRGACFLVEIEDHLAAEQPGVGVADFSAALWDLVWDGRITNDTFAPLRALGRRRPATARGRAGTGYSMAGGRWSLVRALAGSAPQPTERALAQAEVLLGRYGVVSREMAQAEGLSGGFGPLYRVLRAMEEAGRVRRGYFVEGLSGAQFALGGAVERLRALRSEDETRSEPWEGEIRVLAALDPANPFGALLPWPEAGGGDARPRRVPGARVLLLGGIPIVYLAPRGRQVITFPCPAVDEGHRALERAFRALHRLPGQRRSLVIEKIDGVPAVESPLCGVLRSCGFESDYRGLAASPSFEQVYDQVHDLK
jgi:ATP-dependent Lhr-like helicase